MTDKKHFAEPAAAENDGVFFVWIRRYPGGVEAID